jgi:hypothetical protein
MKPGKRAAHGPPSFRDLDPDLASEFEMLIKSLKDLRRRWRNRLELDRRASGLVVTNEMLRTLRAIGRGEILKNVPALLKLQQLKLLDKRHQLTEAGRIAVQRNVKQAKTLKKITAAD